LSGAISMMPTPFGLLLLGMFHAIERDNHCQKVLGHSPGTTDIVIAFNESI
jgi:hydrogenase-4 membrane subunit HyfE